MSIAIPLSVLPARTTRRTEPTVPVTVYGTWWSPRTQQIVHYLRQRDVPHQYANLDTNPEIERQLAREFSARPRLPVVYVEGDWIMSASVSEVETCLEAHGWTQAGPRR